MLKTEIPEVVVISDGAVLGMTKEWATEME